jgi:hypothetical protein
MMAQGVAASALQQIGTPFRLHGRVPGVAFDCVGLVAHCLSRNAISCTPPTDYTLRGQYRERLERFFNSAGFTSVDVHNPCDGDIALACIFDRQFHLLIRASNGWVHAHAGLRRVVHTPDPIGWALLALWRL